MYKEEKNLNNAEKSKLDISDVRYSYEDVEKHCNENGYYIGEYWFPRWNFKYEYLFLR